MKVASGTGISVPNWDQQFSLNLRDSIFLVTELIAARVLLTVRSMSPAVTRATAGRVISASNIGTTSPD